MFTLALVEDAVLTMAAGVGSGDGKEEANEIQVHSECCIGVIGELGVAPEVLRGAPEACLCCRPGDSAGGSGNCWPLSGQKT